MVAHCSQCPHQQGAAVGSIGDPDAEIVIIGEAPGAQEIITDRPFVGVSGRLLWETMRKAGIEDAEHRCFVTNALMCRPPADAAPYLPAIDACRARLMAEVQRVPRKMIITLGNTAMRSVLPNNKKSITAMRGQPLYIGGTLIMPTWHPAAILRNKGVNGPMYKQMMQDITYAVQIARGAVMRKPGETETIVFDVDDDATDAENRESVRDMVRELRRWGHINTYFGADIETGGPNNLYSPILCLGIAFNENQVAMLTDRLLASYKDELQPLFRDPKIRWVWHNGKYDTGYLHTAGFPDARVDEDCMLLHYALDEAKGTHGLKQLAMSYLGAEHYDAEVKKKAKKVKTLGYSTVPRDMLYPYCAKDCDYTLQLFHILRPMVQNDPNIAWLYESMLMRASQFLQRVESRGLYLDRPAIDALERQIKPQFENAHDSAITEIEPEWDTKLYMAQTGAKAEPKKINLGSPKQLKWIIFDRLGLVPPRGMRVNTREKTLDGLRERHAFIRHLLDYRDVAKTMGTYIKGMRQRMDPDGRVRTSFLIHGTETGRLSSRDPNTQNIPRPPDNPGDPNVRDIFGSPPGRILIEVDYSGAELRVLAHFSNDQWLTQVFIDGRDLHTEMATEQFGKGHTKNQRVAAKSLNFGIAYGMKENLLAMTITQKTGIQMTKTDAAAMIDAWFKRCPRAKRFLDKCRAAPATGHMLETPFGRRRRFPLVTREALPHLQNEACNFPIQSVASDLTLISAMELDAPLLDLDVQIINVVHDSILMEAPNVPHIIEQAVRMVKARMREVPIRELGATVPFTADAMVGRNWGTLRKYELPEEIAEREAREAAERDAEEARLAESGALTLV